MGHQIWSIVLFVCAGQSLFMIFALMAKPLANKKANIILLGLLSIILLTTISNIWSATYLYRKFPQIAGFSRGMVLLMGPVFYLYVLSVLKPGFSLKVVQLLHFIPYLIGFTLIRIEEGRVSYQEFIFQVDQFMENGAVISWISSFWFVAYFIHLLLYIQAAGKEIKSSLNNDNHNYLISSERRVAWLKRIRLFFIVIAFVFIGNTIFIISSGRTIIITNYIYNTVLAMIVYFIAFQSISDNKILAPDFSKKYKSNKINSAIKSSLLLRLIGMLEMDKIFIEPALTTRKLAERLSVHQNVLSQVINEHYSKSFSELINSYRIEEFKSRMQDPQYANYSIIGVAYEVGFNTKSAFNSAFKKQTGITPSEYVKNLLQPAHIETRLEP